MTPLTALFRHRPPRRGPPVLGVVLSAVALPLGLSSTLVAVSSVSLRPTTVTAGEQSGGTVTIDTPASTALSVTLASSDPAVAQVPTGILVAARSTTATFAVRTTGPGCASISARAGSTPPRSAMLFVNPASPSTVSLVQLTLATSQITGGQKASGSVTLSRTAAGGATVQLSSSNPLVTVPASVAVPSANTPVTFPIATSAVTTPTCALITATFGASPRSALLQVLP